MLRKDGKSKKNSQENEKIVQCQVINSRPSSQEKEKAAVIDPKRHSCTAEKLKIRVEFTKGRTDGEEKGKKTVSV